MKSLILSLVLTLLLLGADDYQTHKTAKSNNEAATECARDTGFLYNCADGSQAIECK